MATWIAHPGQIAPVSQSGNVGVNALATRRGLELELLELNPVLVHDQGALAVDAVAASAGQGP